MSLKVLFFISDLGSGGTQKSLLHISNYFINKNYRIKFFVFNKSKGSFYDYSDKIEIIYLNKINHSTNFINKIYSNLLKIFLIKKIFNEHDCDYCISMLSQTNVIVSIANLISKKNKLILCERNDPFKQKFNIFWNLLIKFSYKYCTYICVNSPNAYEYFKKYFEDKKIKYVINYVHPKNKIKISDENKTIIAVGRINIQKGYDILIKAFKLSSASKKDWKLKIIGNNSDKLIYKKLLNLSSNELNKSIFFVNETKFLDDIYKKASAYIIASRYEGTPNSFLEAASFGLPCIISDSINLGDIKLIDKKNSLVFKNEDINSCKNSINYLINNYKVNLKYGIELNNLIISNYSLKNATNSWDNIVI